MTESNEGLYLNTKPLADKAKKAVINDTTKKVAVAGVTGFATGFVTVFGAMAAQKMIEKFEDYKEKKMFKKAKKNGEVHEASDLDSTEEVED